MATFVDYNLSTFRDHSKPNKRRLQELQHTEARAHAARVAYWRKRKSGPRSQPKRTAQIREDQTDSYLDDSSVITSSEPHDAHSDTQRLSPQSSSSPGSDQVPRPPAARALDNAVSLRCSTQSASSRKIESALPPDLRFGDLNAFFQLTSHPKSRLFDPFDTVPSRQGEEVVTAMDHCDYSLSPSKRYLLTVCSYLPLGSFSKTRSEIPDQRQSFDKGCVPFCTSECRTLRSIRCSLFEF